MSVGISVQFKVLKSSNREHIKVCGGGGGQKTSTFTEREVTVFRCLKCSKSSGFRKWVDFWLAEELVDFQQGLWSVELVRS